MLLFRKKKKFPDGLNSPIVVVAFPSQSPTKGRSPGAPNATVTSGGADVLVFLRRQRFPLGLNSPIVIVPFPSQSPAIGMSPGAPKVTIMSGTPAELVLRMKKVDVLGL